MDRSLRSFIFLAGNLILGSCLILIGFNYAYHHSSLDIYNKILLILMLLTLITTVFFVFIAVGAFYAYQKRTVFKYFAWIIRVGLNILFPLIEVLSGILKNKKDIIRNFCITLNNIMVQSNLYKYDPGGVLILLPHCLQNSECKFKVTNEVKNCRNCGKCSVGEIKDLAEKFQVKVKVVTGGTAARNVIKKENPKLILSVACERDLASGISDVRTIPVIGVINERPNGPCYNTTLDIKALKQALESVIDPGDTLMGGTNINLNIDDEKIF